MRLGALLMPSHPPERAVRDGQRWDLEEIERLTAEAGVGAVVVPNFAIGAILMLHFARVASRYMASAEIIELHLMRYGIAQIAEDGSIFYSLSGNEVIQQRLDLTMPVPAIIRSSEPMVPEPILIVAAAPPFDPVGAVVARPGTPAPFAGSRLAMPPDPVKAAGVRKPGLPDWPKGSATVTGKGLSRRT